MLQRRDILRTTVAHTCTETTDELEDGILYTALVCDTTLDALWYELLRVRLEVTIRRTILLLHRTERAHATVYLVLTALVELELTRCLVAACEYRTHHDGAATCSDRLHDITGVLDTTIGDDRDTVLVSYLERIHNRGYLRNTDTGNDTGRTDGARSDTDLYAVGAGLDEGLGRLTGRDITRDDLKIRELLLQHADALQNVCTMAMCRVENDDVYMCVDELLCTLDDIGCDTECSTAEESALYILRRVRILHLLLDILDGDETLQITLIIDDRELLYLRTCEDLLRFLEGGTLLRRYEVLARHALADLLRVVLLENEVTVRDDTDELLALGDWHAGDAELRHEIIGILQGVICGQEERIGDDTILRALYHVDFLCLLLDRHILVDDTDTTAARHGDRHLMLCNGIHTCRNEWNVEMN